MPYIFFASSILLMKVLPRLTTMPAILLSWAHEASLLIGFPFVSHLLLLPLNAMPATSHPKAMYVLFNEDEMLQDTSMSNKEKKT